MDEGKITENEIEKLLCKLPKRKDRRDINEVYRAIQLPTKNKFQVRKSFFIPVLTAFTATILFIICLPYFNELNQNESASTKKTSTYNEAGVKSKDEGNKNIEINSVTSNDKKENNITNDIVSDSPADNVKKTAVYMQDLKEHNAVTYGLLTKDALVVPVTILLPKTKDDWEKRYIKTLENMPINTLGFKRVPLFQGSMNYNEKSKVLSIKMNKDEWSEIPESVESKIESIVQYSFAPTGVKQVEFLDEEGNNAQLNNIGELAPEIIEQTPKTGYFSYNLNGEKQLLLPSDRSFTSLEEALNNMKEKPNDFYNAIIPNNVNVEVSGVENNQVNIKFIDKMNLSDGNETDHMNMIEGMLLAAKDFGYSSVFFQNIEPDNWEGFSFVNPIEVPYSVNRIDINSEK